MIEREWERGGRRETRMRQMRREVERQRGEEEGREQKAREETYTERIFTYAAIFASMLIHKSNSFDSPGVAANARPPAILFCNTIIFCINDILYFVNIFYFSANAGPPATCKHMYVQINMKKAQKFSGRGATPAPPPLLINTFPQGNPPALWGWSSAKSALATYLCAQCARVAEKSTKKQKQPTLSHTCERRRRAGSERSARVAAAGGGDRDDAGTYMRD